MLSSLSGNLTWRGVLAIVIGLIAVFWPGITLSVFVVLFALFAFMDGALRAIRAFASAGGGAVAWNLLVALFDVAVGVAALVWPDITVLSMVLIVGIWAVVIGCLEIVGAFADGETAGMRAYLVIAGLVSVALGLVMFTTPDVGALTLALLFGFFSLTYGITEVVVGQQLRQAGSTVKSVLNAAA
jgi:uncharacterized membrane protein HdeD (DUF308 family)